MEGPKKYPTKLSQAQRKLLADLASEFVERLKAGEKNQRSIHFTLDEMHDLLVRCQVAVNEQTKSIRRRTLHGMIDEFNRAIEQNSGIGAIREAERLFQFKITLLDLKPKVWRRIQVRDCTLDKLHEHIQTSMGWTNSHLNMFTIGECRFVDPLLFEDDFEHGDYEDSTVPFLSTILPQDGKRFKFRYLYDFGDHWEHEVLFEGCVKATKGQKYPLCVEGERACPPEDVGGVYGYEDFLDIMADPDHEQHDEMMEWRGEFHSEAFSADEATKRMKEGLRDWRKEFEEEKRKRRVKKLSEPAN